MKSERVRFLLLSLLFVLAVAALPAQPATVYFSSKVDSATLMAMYDKLGVNLSGKVAVKLHSGEGENSNNLRPAFVKDLVTKVNGTIVECNTAYGGNRATTAMHKQIMVDRGYAAIAPFEILDEKGDVSIPVPQGTRIKEDFVGAGFKNYDSMLVLTHFKGHQMGGFGGSLKNISIGLASTGGKLFIHTAGKTSKGNFFQAFSTDQAAFVESMAEAASAVIAAMGSKNIVYINVMNKLSIDCDCVAHPKKPEIADIGILASTDPVALDRACVDLIYKADPKHAKSFKDRLEKQLGTLILAHGEEIGIGSQAYTLVSID